VTDRERDRDGGDIEFRAPPGQPHTRGVNPVGAVVGTLLVVAGGLFLLQVRVELLVVGPLGVRPVVLSAVTLTVAILLGGLLFLSVGRRRMALGHGGTGAGWTLLLLGTWTDSGLALLLGAGVIGSTVIALVYEHYRS
jgi:hypothetical protein